MTPTPRGSLAALGLVVLATACVAPGFSPDADWTKVLERDWEVVRLDGAAPLEGTTLPLRFEAPAPADDASDDPDATAPRPPDRVVGQAVNTFSGACERDGYALSFGPLMATRMFRDDPPGAMDQEQRLLGLLGRVRSWRLDSADGGLRLVLRSDGGHEVVLAPAG